MRKARFKKIFRLFGVCCLVMLNAEIVLSQQPQKCLYNEEGSGTSKLTYTVSHPDLNSGVFYTDYNIFSQVDVFDRAGVPFKTIRIANNSTSNSIDIIMMDVQTGKEDKHYQRKYSATSGLIIDQDSDNVEKVSYPNRGLYLMSFDDENRTYLNLHYISKTGDYSIRFDKISDTLLQKNSNMLQQLRVFNKFHKQQEEEMALEEKNRQFNAIIDSITTLKVNDILNKHNSQNNNPNNAGATPVASQIPNAAFLNEIDVFYQKYMDDSMAVVAIDSTITSEIKRRFGNSDKVMNTEEGAYQGDLSSGARQGEGMFIPNSREIYLGKFIADNFVSGKAAIKYKDGRKYYGCYAGKNPAGLGQMWYPNSEMELGIFDKAGFESGIIRKKDANGNTYFGQSSNNKKEGFGFFITPKGDLFIGAFKEDRPDNGYYSQFDDLGFKTVSRIKDGIKNPVASSEWDNVADEIKKLRLAIK